ncbi:hypothetical protein [Clostridium aceticum]|nr:hypothetical protein [Clostridium aceticum]
MLIRVFVIQKAVKNLVFQAFKILRYAQDDEKELSPRFQEGGDEWN